MKRTKNMAGMILLFAVFLVSGCAAFRSDIGGAYPGEARRNEQADKVSVAFIFSHARQMKGMDTIPKLNSQRQIISGFADFFNDALPEITNIGTYATFTEHAADVNEPKRRAERDSLTAANDYMIRMRFLRETSFAQRTLGIIASSLTVMLAPVPYRTNYTVTADVYDHGGRLVKRYERNASVTQWIEMFLLFVYPFHPERLKTEQVYVAFLHDIFREIEADRVLSATGR